MEAVHAQVHAWVEAGFSTIECTVCGPLGVAPEAQTDMVAVGHMQDVHGAEFVTR